jgi:uncharacterized protein
MSAAPEAPSSTTAGEGLSARYVLEYSYRRSVGPVLGRFFAGLRDGKIVGARTASGAVLVPPGDCDPRSGAPLGEFVELAPTGVVTTWSWNPAPKAGQPLERPFAWALVRIDGAEGGILHAVDAGSIDAMKTGMRVRAKFREQRVGAMSDLLCFVPEEAR